MISIVIPTLNEELNIKKTLKKLNSIKSFRNYEYIIVDDNSSDNTEKEVNKFTLGSYQKAKALLGWSPKMPFLLGLKTTADFAKSMFEQDNARIKVSAKL